MTHKLFCSLACAVALSAWNGLANHSSTAMPAINLFDSLVGSAMAQSEVSTEPSQDGDLERRFDQALTLMDTKQWSQAETAWCALIEASPDSQALYLNLAAVLAQRGKLEQARETLLLGLEQRVETADLYTALTQVHGALAASAYSKVLDGAKTDTKPVPLALPVLRRLNTSPASSQGQLDVEKARQQDLLFDQLTQQVARLEMQLSATQNQHQRRVIELELALQKQRQLNQKQAEELQELRNSSKPLARSESSALSGQASDSEPSGESKNVYTSESEGESASQASLGRAAEVQESTASVTNSNSLDAVAIDLVRAWASAWEARNLNAYINYYVSGYTPGRFVSHDAWLQQNRTRFSSTEEVAISVSDFVVSDLGTQFAVTFTQHYHSKTFDESIRKRLVFELDGDGGAWSAAKIVSEHTVSG